MNDIIKQIPPMLCGDELISALSIFPEYDANIRYENQAVRLMALADIYNLYIPSQMSIEIYNKLYLSLIRSLQKKRTKTATRQQYENFKAIKGKTYDGIIGGADSFTIIGASGIGKSSAISRAVSLIGGDTVIEVENPYTKIIPCISVQCPFDSSVKGLLLEILRKVDEALESDYYSHAIRARATTDMLIGCVSQVALNHIGLLIVDEIQNVANSKNGKHLIGALTQLINNSGISICMVGTPESAEFFESAMQLARRSVGLRYGALEYDDYFEKFCRKLWSYQYIGQPSECPAAAIAYLYAHSAGIIAVVVSLVHDAQQIAIERGTDTLNVDALKTAYEQRLTLLRDYIDTSIGSCKPGKKTKNQSVSALPDRVIDNNISLSALAERSKSEGADVVPMIKEHFSVTEVAV